MSTKKITPKTKVMTKTKVENLQKVKLARLITSLSKVFVKTGEDTDACGYGYEP